MQQHRSQLRQPYSLLMRLMSVDNDLFASDEELEDNKTVVDDEQ